jgi:hypothetical protein
VNCAHLIATEFVQEISTSLAKDLVRDRLNFQAAVGIERQKSTSIEIHSVDGPSVCGQKNGLLLEASLDCVSARAFCLGCDRHESPTRQVRLYEINALFWSARGAADGKPQRFGER